MLLEWLGTHHQHHSHLASAVCFTTLMLTEAANLDCLALGQKQNDGMQFNGKNNKLAGSSSLTMPMKVKFHFDKCKITDFVLLQLYKETLERGAQKKEK